MAEKTDAPRHWRVWLIAEDATVDVLEAALEDALAPGPLSMARFEAKASRPDAPKLWRLQALTALEPDIATLALGLAAAMGKAGAGTEVPDFHVEPLEDEDWLALNRRQFPPVEAGRFFIHGSHFDSAAPTGKVVLQLDAGPAFGSGTHETTRGCLLAIDELLAAHKPARVLDVGCGSGELAAVLRAAGHTVLGVDQREPDSVAMRMDRYVAADLGDGLPDEVGGGFGIVIAADVVEHLADPTLLMQDLAAAADPDGSVIISVPNFGHWYPRLRVALGRWDYDERGILDRTHLRFFNRRTFLRAAADAGLTPRRSSNTGLPFDALRLDERSLVLRPIAAVDRLLARVWPNLFAYQLIYEFRTSVPDELRRKGERGFSS